MNILVNILNFISHCFFNFFKFLLTVMFYSYSILIVFGIFALINRFKISKVYKKTKKSINGLYFMPYVKLPKSKNFFINCLKKQNNIFRTVLPIIDFNDYDFTNVCIENCVFHKDSILPEDIDFFQKIQFKSIRNCTLPNGDYSKYNFKNVAIDGCVFTEESILPLDYNFFKDLRHYGNLSVTLPKMFNDYCHLYNLSDVHLHLPKKINVRDSQALSFLCRSDNEPPNFINLNTSTLKSLKYTKKPD